MIRAAFLATALTGAALPALAQPAVSGEQQVWRAVTLDFAGPELAETSQSNPFTDYLFDVTFTQGDKSFRVPGYFAACGNAAVTSCESGNVWRVHFTPDAAGKWDYEVTFRRGDDIILTGTGGTALPGLNGYQGTLDIAPIPAGSTDPRDRGRLQYTGRRYLTFAETGEVLFKAGADAPENTLAFADFDATPNRGDRLKTWERHVGDAESIDLNRYGWNGKGAGLLGAIEYLASEGMNAFSFLTFSLGGDDQNVFPHLLRVSEAEYETLEPRQQWDEGVYKTRFDVSKLDQWGRVFDYGNDRGMFLHFKLQELENDDFMDGGDTGIERIAYLRQLIARYSHYLVLNWNNGEENTQYADQEIASIAKIAELDPYQHHRVTHSYPGRKIRHFPLLGDRSELTGLSMQAQVETFLDIRPEIAEWVLRSAAAGRPWAIASDEQGGGRQGIPVDADYPDALLPNERIFEDKRDEVRAFALWGTLTAGGWGVEYYGGYGSGCGDLSCQDHRARASKWRDAKVAIDFFSKHVGTDAFGMEPLNLTSGTGQPFWFGRPDATKFVVYAHDGRGIRERGMVQHSLYRVSWFDPLTGKMAKSEVLPTVNRNDWIGMPDTLATGPAPGDDIEKDWVLLIEHIGPNPDGAPETEVLLTDSFSERTLAGHWWQRYERPQFRAWNGVLVGGQINPDHGATIRTDLEFSDVVLEFDAKFMGASGFNFVIDDKNATDVTHAGHVARLTVRPSYVQISDDITGKYKLEHRAMPPAEREAASEGTTVTYRPNSPLDDGEWHNYRLQIIGDNARLYHNGEAVAWLSSPGFAHPTKTNFGFTVNGGDMHFDNVRVTRPQ